MEMETEDDVDGNADRPSFAAVPLVVQSQEFQPEITAGMIPAENQELQCSTLS